MSDDPMDRLHVCLTHKAFIPCRREGDCIWSDDPVDVAHVRECQQGTTPTDPNQAREALNDSAYTAIQDGVEPMDWLNRNRDAVLRALGAKPVYASQDWVDADGVRSGWRTGYGYYTHSHEDAKRHLAWDRSNFDGEQFRLATAWLTDWEDYTDE